MISVDVYRYGAKSTAIGVARAIKLNYGKWNILGFIVSSLNGNPDEIEGIRVEELDNLTKKKSNEEKKYTNVIIATPVYVQEEIRNTLIEKGFTNIFSLSTYDEENMMREYYAKIAKFPSIKNLDGNSLLPKTFILEVKHHKDAEVNNIYNNPSWVYPIQAGAACTKERIANLLDCEGDNISAINPLYCEETALYWLWKNMLEKDVNKYDYYGLYHYQKWFNLIKCMEKLIDKLKKD